MPHVGDHAVHVRRGHDLPALLVDHLALIVHDVVELQQVLADVEVACLDLLLRLFQRLVDPGMGDRLALLQAQPLEHAVELVRGEDPHQIVFQGQEEQRPSGITLPAGAAAELIVDPPALMPFGADHEQPAGSDHRLLLHRMLVPDPGFLLRPLVGVDDLPGLLGQAHVQIAAELDVGAAAGHVGGDGHGTRPASLGDDHRLLLVEAGVEHLVGDLVLLEQPGEVFRLLDRHRADQHRLLSVLGIADGADDGVVLLARGAVDLVVEILPRDGHVGGDLHHLEPIDLPELLGLGLGGAGHPGELGIQAEIVLEGDRSERLVLPLDLHPFPGLDRLVQAFGVAPSFHHPAGELVDDDHPAVLDDVVPVLLEQHMGAQGLLGVVHQADVADVVEPARRQRAPGFQELLDLLLPFFGQVDRALLLVELVVLGRDVGHDAVDQLVELGAVLGGAGDDQRRPRLVDQDRIDLVDDGVGVRALHHVGEPELHVVPQIVEAELVVGAVGDIRGVGRPALDIAQPVHDHPDLQAEKRVDPAHPGGVPASQIVVDGDDVHPVPGQGVEIDRHGGDQGLALPGLHLADLALVQNHPADELHVERAHAQGALGRFPHGGEGFRQQRVEGLPLRMPALELLGLGAQGRVV